MPDHRRIALLIESSRGYGRDLLRGIAAYGRVHGPWLYFHQGRELGAPVPLNLQKWRPDGIIARLTGTKMIGQIRAMRLPTVDLYYDDEAKDIPGVETDQETLVQRAVDHFLERGFKHFAYCGFPSVLFSDLRAEYFTRQLASRGLSASQFKCPPASKNAGTTEIESHVLRFSGQLAKWLRDLPKPVALLACNDMRGHQVLTACDECRIAVPDEVAVLGVDNDDVLCELCNPTLSSIDPRIEKIGYEAAAFLDRLLRGEPSSQTRIIIEPGGIVTRRSTDVLAIADRDAAEAIWFVRERAASGMEVGKILAQLSFSRSTLDRWFRKWLGRTPGEEITRIQIDHVKDLLESTDFSLKEIAIKTGFRHVESLYRVMKRVTGQTPGEYRQQIRKPEEAL